MVKNIYFIKIPYSNFNQLKARPILIFKKLENDFLFLPITSNLKKDGIILSNDDLEYGQLKKKSVVVVPKISAIDKNLIVNARLLATVNENKFNEVLLDICKSLQCLQ